MWEQLGLSVFSQPDAWVALLSLAALEIVLGVDNLIFVAIVANRLPPEHRGPAYRLGLIGALVTRLGLLMALSWLMRLTEPLFHLLDHDVSGRDLILLFGGLFLIVKSVHEIYVTVEGPEQGTHPGAKRPRGLLSTIVVIMIMDMVFSLDSIITAIGISDDLPVMVIAIVIAMIVMLAFAQSLGDFVNKHPSLRVLALAFLLLIGVLLTGEAFGQHIPKGYVYTAMAFALLVELLNMRARKKTPSIMPPSTESVRPSSVQPSSVQPSSARPSSAPPGESHVQ